MRRVVFRSPRWLPHCASGPRGNVDAQAAAIQTVLRTERLDAPATLADAYSAQVRAGGGHQRDEPPDLDLEDELGSGLRLGEFGDDPKRYQDARSRKNYAGTCPLTKASSKKRSVVARFVRNCYLQTPATDGPTPRSAPTQMLEPSTASGPPTKPTVKPFASCPTVWSVSSPAAYAPHPLR